MKKLITTLAIAALSIFGRSEAYGQFTRGEHRSDVIEYLQLIYNYYDYQAYGNGDIYLNDENDITLWKFDYNNRIVDIYYYYNTGTEDETERNELNRSNQWYHPYADTWQKYYTNGNICEKVTFGPVNIYYGDKYNIFNHGLAWHFHFSY